LPKNLLLTLEMRVTVRPVFHFSTLDLN
jgi:hypothetical protein